MTWRFLETDPTRAFFRTDVRWPMRLTSKGDIETITGRPNLEQAISARTATGRGEVEHRPEYGLELEEHLGAPNVEEEHAVIQSRILDQLRAEPRLSEVKTEILGEDGDVYAHITGLSRDGAGVQVQIPLVRQ